MNIQIIDQLLSIPGNQEESTIKLKRVEGFWQADLRTVGKSGLNTIDELLRNLLSKTLNSYEEFSTLIDSKYPKLCVMDQGAYILTFNLFKNIRLEWCIRPWNYL